MLYLVASRSDPNLTFESTIRVKDLAANKNSFVEAIENNLKDQKEVLERNRQAKLGRRDFFVSTFKSVNERVNDWIIQRVDENTYYITGSSLGWTDKLTDGQWIYHRDKKELTPFDSRSIALRNILTANL